jgi:hypothetical protein
MKVTLFHEIDPSSQEGVLQGGIKRKASGDKTDPEKKKIDTFLDTHLPDWAQYDDVYRGNVLYGYLADGDGVVDISTGDVLPLKKFMAASDQTLLRIKVDEEQCYVSDLDLYDTLVRAMELDEQDSTREHLADRYWQRIIPLRDYEQGTIKRPEVMVAADIKPEEIEVVKDEKV